MKAPRPAGVAWVGSMDPVVNKLLPVRKSWTKHENGKATVYPLNAQLDGKRGYRQGMHQG